MVRVERTKTALSEHPGRWLVTLAAAAVMAFPCASGAQVFGDATSRFRAGPLDVTLRFREERLRQMENQIRPVLAGAIERYTEIFGGPPRGSDGQPLLGLNVRIQSDPLGGGDAEPGMLHLLIGRQPMFGFYDWRLTLLHEAFHLWNAHSFRYAGPSEQWFSEGAAEFYAMQTAARLGIVDEMSVIRNAGTTIGFYTSALDQHRMSLVEAGQQKGAHYFLVYHGGWTAALLLDHAIRGKTGNARSLDDVMRWMYATFGESRPYTTMDLARGVREATGQDMTDFFAKHVMGRLPLPVSATLNLGELARNLQARRAGVDGIPAPDSLLLHSLGIEERRR